MDLMTVPTNNEEREALAKVCEVAMREAMNTLGPYSLAPQGAFIADAVVTHLAARRLPVSGDNAAELKRIREKWEHSGYQPWKDDAFRALEIAEASQPSEAAPSDTDEDQRILAWMEVADHEAFTACYKEERPLIESVMDRLTDLVSMEQTITELKPSHPVQVEVSEGGVTIMAKHMANAASDWVDNCDEDEHPLEHSNWVAYTDDARRGLVAALGGGDHAE